MARLRRGKRVRSGAGRTAKGKRARSFRSLHTFIQGKQVKPARLKAAATKSTEPARCRRYKGRVFAKRESRLPRRVSPSSLPCSNVIRVVVTLVMCCVRGALQLADFVGVRGLGREAPVLARHLHFDKLACLPKRCAVGAAADFCWLRHSRACQTKRPCGRREIPRLRSG